MNVVFNSRKADGKKGLEIVTLSKETAEAIFNAFVGKSVSNDNGDVKVKQLTSERQASAEVLAEKWEKVAAKYPNLDTIVISDYVTARSVGKVLTNGEKVNKLVEFPATMTISNMNLQAILTGIASDLASEEGKISKATKSLYNASCEEKADGYTGKRGRTKKVVNKAALKASVFADL